MNNSIIILLRVPFLDRIPSLKSLVILLASKGCQITIITSFADCYPTFEFTSENINVKLIKERSCFWEVPTSIKLFYYCFIYYFKVKPIWFIGGDGVASYLLFCLSHILPIKSVNFLLEYPQINNKKDFKSMKSAKYIITHDQWHRDFILQHFKLNKEKFLYLPNASHTPPYYKSSDYLSKLLNVKGKRIILHSGGLGVWFCCKELAAAASSWDDDTVLIFHTSHKVEDSPYYQEIIKALDNSQKVMFSTTPVSNDVLDKLVSSAYIGVALYSVPVLDYRATYMGLAAGKIGNYLKCGVPVIATNLPSLKYIEEYQCGILVDDVSQIKGAISIISQQRDQYSQNAHRCYKELWEPSHYLENIYLTLQRDCHETRIQG